MKILSHRERVARKRRLRDFQDLRIPHPAPHLLMSHLLPEGEGLRTAKRCKEFSRG
jgi:hypothetical protein